MMLTSAVSAGLTLGQAGLYALLGYAVVFFGLILLMLVIIATSKCFTAGKKQEAPQPVPAEPAPAAAAPGAAGQVKLHNVEPRTAAMLMAIVADKLQKPVNELRFLSIKEVEK